MTPMMGHFWRIAFHVSMIMHAPSLVAAWGGVSSAVLVAFVNIVFLFDAVYRVGKLSATKTPAEPKS